MKDGKEKLSFNQNLLVGSLLFGLFFGAGNLIFPVQMGQTAGSHTIPATVGLDEFLEVPMDGTLIVQVLINLLENAIKYSPGDSPVEVRLEKNGEWARFEVLDRGKGISDENFLYLLTSHKSTENKISDSSRGMGIGLSICKTIVKAHNGKLEAENRKEGGTIFRFSLPLKGSE